MTTACLLLALVPLLQEERRDLDYAPAPAGNPLKGLVPYAGAARGAFPHSLEFGYLAFSALVKDEDRYDWTALDRLLDGAAGRGCQAVFRVYLEYPGRKGVLPDYLLRGGLKVHRYLNTNTQPLPPSEVETPDYGDPALRRALRAFILALGARVDGDPRLGYVTAGLLGTWGEWHTWPREELFASKEVQSEVMDAYQAAFKRTPVLLRYPAGPGHRSKAPNAGRPFGYHDDSFAWATLATGRPSDSWHFMALLRAAGPEALDAWKSRPIGGEIRPEAWGRVFDSPPGDPRIQDFRACVEATHATWLMDSGMFGDPSRIPPDRVRRAEEAVRRMGYEFHVRSVTLWPPRDGHRRVRLEIENRGVAPFYHDWTPEFGILDASGTVLRRVPARGRLAALLPGDPPRIWEEDLDLAGPGTLALRVPNPLPKGPPLRFANRDQDADADGWLTLRRGLDR